MIILIEHKRMTTNIFRLSSANWNLFMYNS
jgi:hypothetical protein